MPKRMIAREPTVVRSSLVNEDEPARLSRVPRVRRNHVQRGPQLSVERFSHPITLAELSNIPPLSRSCQNRDHPSLFRFITLRRTVGCLELYASTIHAGFVDVKDGTLSWKLCRLVL